MVEHKDEGILDKILTLVAPPLPTASQKGRGGGKKAKSSSTASNLTTPAPATTTATPSVRHSGMQNHPYCDACGDGGNLLCCDTCPTSFHFNCCDPPIDPKNIPSGDWLCRRCRAQTLEDGVPQVFQPLVELAMTSNPLVFNIPYEMQRRDILPGSSRKELKHARLTHHHHGHDSEQKFCYTCNKSTSHGRMVACDFCPLTFHLDCLQPPLTIPPTTVWMCPVHPNSKIPGFDHPRLSQRLKALERGQSDISYHTIKGDFIKQLRRIPYYKRITKHHKRRVTEVPAAIKCLYMNPLPDTSQVLPLSDSVLTPEEDVERWRMEEEISRKLFTVPRQPVLTHNQDEWTRRAVLCHSKDGECLDNNDGKRALEGCDSSVRIAAQQLLELSTARTITGKGSDGESEGVKQEIKPLSVPPVNGVIKYSNVKNGTKGWGMLNGKDTGHLCSIDEDEEINNLQDSDLHSEQNTLPSSNNHHVTTPDLPESPTPSPVPPPLDPSPAPSRQEETEGEVPMDVDKADHPFVPDFSHLDPKLVQLLAVQRLQELFTELTNQRAVSSNPPNKDGLQTNASDDRKQEYKSKSLREQEEHLLNGLRQCIRPPTLWHLRHTNDSLQTASALLCPLSGTAFAVPLLKQVTSIGIGSEMDVSLSEYGHCNYVSPRQACIFYDKVTHDYELINYSEHGTVVDGVLYSCDFSDKSTSPPPSLIPHCTTPHNQSQALFQNGQKIALASAKLEAARILLRNKQEARRAQEGALRLSAPVKDDFSLAEEMSKCEGLMTRTGLKRVTAETSSSSGGNSSVVLSIPLFKTRKSEAAGNSPKRNTSKGRSPAKMSEPKEEKNEPAVIITNRTQVPLQKKQVSKAVKTEPIKTLPTPTPSAPPIQSSCSEETIPQIHHSIPCHCRKSLSSMVGSNGKGWEGTATLYHGSRLRFGCLQFILSIAGRPGHTELVQALSKPQTDQEKNNLLA